MLRLKKKLIISLNLLESDFSIYQQWSAAGSSSLAPAALASFQTHCIFIQEFHSSCVSPVSASRRTRCQIQRWTMNSYFLSEVMQHIATEKNKINQKNNFLSVDSNQSGHAEPQCNGVHDKDVCRNPTKKNSHSRLSLTIFQPCIVWMALAKIFTP